MKQHASPPSSSKGPGDNGRSIATPKNRKKSPGDIFGSGKSQLPITQYFSPVSSSSDRSSQPYSPITFSLKVKRQASTDSPAPNKSLRTKTVSKKQPVVSVSSDDSSDEVFTNAKSCSPAVVPKSRLSLIKRCLYPVTSSPVSSSHKSARTKKKLLPKRKSRVLSDSDSDSVVPTVPKRRSKFCKDYLEGVFPMENSQRDTKTHLDVVSLPSQAIQARSPCPETSSQAVVISSSDDSDFELHNSKQSLSFSSQSAYREDIPHTNYLSQTNRVGFTETVGSSSIGKPPTGVQKLPKKRCSRGSDSNSLASSSNCDTKISTASGLDVFTSPVGREKTLFGHLPVSLKSNGGDPSLYDLVESKCLNNESKDDVKTLVPLISGHNGVFTAINLDDRAPPPDKASIQVETSESDQPGICKARISVSTKRDVSRNTACQGSMDSPSRNAAECCSPTLNEDVSSIYLQGTLPFLPDDSSIQLETGETNHYDPCEAQFNSPTKQCTPRNTARQVSAVSGHHTVITCSPSPGNSIYNEETLNPWIEQDNAVGSDTAVDSNAIPKAATALANDFGDDPNAVSDWCSTVEFDHKSLPNVLSTSTPANGFEAAPPGYSQKCTIIEPSDDEDEPIMMENHSGRVSGNDRTSLGVISELLDVSHISASDNSDLSDIVYSDDGLTVDKIRPVSGSPNALATHLSSLLVEGSDESSSGITSMMNSVMDASADFFSDVVAAFEAEAAMEEQGQLDGKKLGKEDFCQTISPTKGIVNIALDIAGLERASDSSCPVVEDQPPSSNARREILSEEAYVPTAEVGNANLTSPQSCSTLPDALVNPVSDSCMNVEAARVIPSPCTPGTVMTGTKSDCIDAIRCCMSKVEEAVLAHNAENVPLIPLQSCNLTPDVVATPTTDSCTKPVAPVTNLHITHNTVKTLLQNPNQLLLDTVISECHEYAEHIVGQEPIKSFSSQYSALPQTSKIALHGCLLELLEDSNHWLKYQELSASSIDTLVSSGILEYLNNNDDLVTKLNHLEFSEITEVLCKLGNSPSESIETMSIILNKLSSVSTCERVKTEIIDSINRKFVKLTESALFCIKICLELFVLPLNLCDKLYKTVEIARFANNLIRNSNRFLLLPLRTSKMIVSADRVLCDLSSLCRLKSGVFGSALNDVSIYLRVNDICSSIAVLDVSAESDPSVRNSPTFRFLMTNYVHALDEQLKTLLCCNTSNIEFGACVYLGVLLQQNVTGFQHKVKWCRERLRYLEKLFDSTNFFGEISKVIKEPADPVQFIVRSEFVSTALKTKKYRLSHDEKLQLIKILRPISHKRTRLAYMPLNNYLNCYPVLTRKPKGKNFNLIRANIFEMYKSDFPCGVEDSGSLLLNGIFLTFWQVIYQNVAGVFLNKFQDRPLDWGSEDFFLKRGNSIEKLVLEIEKHGIPAVLTSMNTIFEQFVSYRCVVDWQLVAPNMSKIISIVETLGLPKFLKISIYVLEKLDQRILGFPDIVLWNPESKTIKFLALKKPADPLFPYQVLWLEKLGDFELDAVELQISGYAGPEQCSQLE